MTQDHIQSHANVRNLRLLHLDYLPSVQLVCELQDRFPLRANLESTVAGRRIRVEGVNLDLIKAEFRYSSSAGAPAGRCC